VSVGGLLGIAQLGNILGKKSDFCGAHSRKYVVEYEVDSEIEQWSTMKITQQSHRVA